MKTHYHTALIQPWFITQQQLIIIYCFVQYSPLERESCPDDTTDGTTIKSKKNVFWHKMSSSHVDYVGYFLGTCNENHIEPDLKLEAKFDLSDCMLLFEASTKTTQR